MDTRTYARTHTELYRGLMLVGTRFLDASSEGPTNPRPVLCQALKAAFDLEAPGLVSNSGEPLKRSISSVFLAFSGFEP